MKKFLNKIRKYFTSPTKVVGLNPTSFQERWSIIAKPYQLISLLIIFLVLTFYVSTLLLSYTSLHFLLPKSVTVESQDKIIKTVEEVENLSNKLEHQDRYIQNLQNVILGKVSIDSIFEITDEEVYSFNKNDIDTIFGEEEVALSREVERRNQEVTTEKPPYETQFMVEPVSGKLSQSFDIKDHPAVDIVTESEASILSINDGFVINSNFSDLDGWVIIIKHKNGFTSIYKHCSKLFKEVGDKVSAGDVIGIVGNTGDRSSGPHLHFELWGNSGPLNPKDYFSFD